MPGSVDCSRAVKDSLTDIDTTTQELCKAEKVLVQPDALLHIRGSQEQTNESRRERYIKPMVNRRFLLRSRLPMTPTVEPTVPHPGVLGTGAFHGMVAVDPKTSAPWRFMPEVKTLLAALAGGKGCGVGTAAPMATLLLHLVPC
ncbi:hypothetical protein KC354_g116 [Hortaea werneckii]|nr:hypothetical protein KC354_g116 [Hortaea werneckii]